MKNLKLKKIVAAVVAAMTIATISPVGASAAWKQNSTGWWNTEGNSYSIGWRNIGNTWYYFDSTGYMKTGWANDRGTWYYLEKSGAMKTGWINDNGTWYYLQSSGAMKTGWINDNGTWYFTESSGAMQTGVVEIDGKVYCLAPSGAMLTGNVVINGVTYTFAASGEAVGAIPKVDKAFNILNGQVSAVAPSSTDNSSSSSSSGGGGGSHKTTAEKINESYKDVAKVNIEKVTGENNQYRVNFVKNEIKLNNYDYVTRDLYITDKNGNNDGIDIDKQEDGSYIVTDNNAKGIKIRGVIKVVEDGKIYYVS